MKSRLCRAIGAALGMSMAVSGVQAQEDAMEEIVVTGSFLYTGVESPSPVTVLGGEDIKAQAPADLLTFFFDNVPQNFSNDIGAQVGGNGQPRNRGGGRNATINLRGIGNENSLSVLNGRRTINYPGVDGQGWPTTSINSIVPRIAISRVETLLDGGSAIFGSDPVAGVVNFITDNQFRGFDVTYDKRINEESSSAANDVLGVMWGGGNERTNVVIAGEFTKTDRIFLSEIELDSNNPDVTPETGTGLTSMTGLNFDAAMGATWVDPDCGNPAFGSPLIAGYPAFEDPADDFIRETTLANATSCAYSSGFDPALSIQNEIEQNTLFLSVEHQFSDTLSANLEVNYATQDYDELDSWGDNVGTVWVIAPIAQMGNFAIPAAHPGLLRAQALDPAFGMGAMGIFMEGETLPFNSTLPAYTETDMSRIALAFDGELTDNWQWHLDVTTAKYDLTLAVRDMLVPNYELAINGFGGPNCGVTDVTAPGGATPGAGGCSYYNPFMSAALPDAAAMGLANDPAMLDWLIPNRIDDFTADFYSTDFIVTGNVGELAGGPIGVALGVAYRKDKLARDIDDNANTFNTLAATGLFEDWSGDQDVSSIFFELALPLAENINLQIAARNEDYGENISETTPKIAFNWTPTDDLTLRASFGTSFRGPSIVHSQATQIFTGMNMRNITLGSQMFGMAGVIAFPYELRANPEVLPQTADNFSAGFDYDVGERISIGATWTSIEFADRIASPTAPTLMNSEFCLLLDGNGTPILSPGGDIQRIQVADGGCVTSADGSPGPVTPLNIGSVVGDVFNAGDLDAEFVDLRATMNFDPGNTSLRFTPSVTITTKYDFSNATNAVGVDNLCVGGICDGIGRDITATTGMGGGFNGVTSMPRWQANFPVLWNITDRHSVRLNVNFRDGINAEWNDLSPEQQSIFQRNDGQWVTNLNYNYRFPNDATTITFLVNNLTAQDPPAAAGGRFNRRLREYGIQLRHSFDN